MMNFKFVKYRIAVANCDHQGMVNKAEDYLYSSASSYLSQGNFVEIELLELDNTIGFIES